MVFRHAYFILMCWLLSKRLAAAVASRPISRRLARACRSPSDRAWRLPKGNSVISRCVAARHTACRAGMDTHRRFSSSIVLTVIGKRQAIYRTPLSIFEYSTSSGCDLAPILPYPRRRLSITHRPRKGVVV